MVSCIVIFLALVVSVSSQPAEGIYAIFSASILQQWGAQLAMYLGDEANTYTATPDINGQTDSATYTFSKFIYDIDLEQFTYSSSGTIR